MTVDELLKPRYKVIAPMPVLPFKVGEIDCFDIYPIKVGGEQFYVRLDCYPHLFKKLEWHEERDMDDMPTYVKDSLNRVVKTMYQKIGGKLLCYDAADDTFPYKWDKIVPATEEEFNNYIKQNND